MKALVIQQKMLGDVLVSSIIARHIKEFYKDVTIHFLVNEGFEDVIKNNPYIDEILLFSSQDRKKIKGFYSFLKKIHRNQYDVVIDAYGKIESMLITASSRANIRVSYQKWYSKLVYSHPIDRSKQLPYGLGLALDHRLLLVEPVVSEIKKPRARPRIYISEAEEAHMTRFLKKNGIRESEKMLMIGVLGSEPAKTYPLEYMAKVLDSIVSNRPDLILLFNFIPSQKVEVEKLISFCQEQTVSKINENLYTEDLRVFLALLSKCEGLVSNEGGAVNMAKAAQIPTFSIHSPWISKEGWHTFYEDTKHEAVHLMDFAPELFQKTEKKEWKKEAQDLYSSFKPEYFLDSLKNFLHREIAE
nr:glycosyltransferase family 9 protein [uncultured Allomuricauda sp.]